MKNNYNQKNNKKIQKENYERKEEKNYDDQVEGRNSVLELLESGKDINKIFIAKGERHGSINKIIAIAKEKGIIIVEKDKRQMDEMAQNQNYQGVIAIVPPFEYCEIEDIIDYAKEKNYEYPTMKYIAEKGNCVFEVLGPIDSEYYIASYMPKELTDMQLYFLELMRDTIKSAKLIETKKIVDGGIEYFSEQTNEMTAEDYFYDVILESYFNKKEKTMK